MKTDWWAVVLVVLTMLVGAAIFGLLWGLR